MPPRRRRDAAASPEPQRATPAGDMFHWSILFPPAHWDSPSQEGNERDDLDIVYNQARQIQSFRWLQARTGRGGTKGFLLIKQLAPLNRLLLVHDLYTDELLINKRVRKYLKKPHLITLYRDRNIKNLARRLPRHLQMYAHPIPGDIRFARLGDRRDPRVELHLPDEPYFQKLYAYGFPHDLMDGDLDHGMVERDGGVREEVYNASLYYEYLNGGSLEHAIMRINWGGERSQFVEEPFIWHLIEQLARALLFLHWGVERQGNERMPLEDGGRIPRDWQSVCHRWLTMDNIMLHWPEEGEEGYEESVDGRLPRVVLTNFDNAAKKGEQPHDNGIIHFGRLSLPKERIKEARYGVSPRDRIWQMEEPDTWQDIYAMGKLLRRVILDRGDEGDDIPREGQKNWFNAANYSLRHYAQSEGGPYSDELIEAIRWFESTGPNGPVVEWQGNARFTAAEKPGPLNSVAGLEDLLIERIAEPHVKTFRENRPPVAEGKVSIATVRPPDLRHYHMPFRTKEIRERDAEEEMQVMMESLNGPAYKVLVEYGPEHENARLAKTDKMREVEEKRAAEEREMNERVENMFQQDAISQLGQGAQEDERQDYRERLRKRKDREFHNEVMGLVGKKIKKARKRYERQERQEEEEAAEGSE